MLPNKPSMTQKGFIFDYILINETLNKHFDLTDRDEVWTKLSDISYEQYRFLNNLIINKEAIKLNNLLTSLGFQRKI